jgi:hypothetical protein
VVNNGSNPVGAWDGTSWVIGNNYTTINGVQVTDQEAEVNASIAVTLDGSQSGSWNAGLQTWQVTSPPCSPVTFQINGTPQESIAAGATFNLIATLDGVAGGTYTPATDTLAFTSANDLTINIAVAVSAVSATFTVAAITAGSITAVNAGGLGSFVIKKNAGVVTAPFTMAIADVMLFEFSTAASATTIVLTGTF